MILEAFIKKVFGPTF